MDVNYDAARFWFSVVQWLLTIGVWIYVWITNRSRVTSARIETLEKGTSARIEAQGNRLAMVEEALRHAPSHDHLSDLHEKVNRVGNVMQELRGELSAIQRTLSLINEHLINAGRRA